MVDKKEIDALCQEIISCCIEVHKILGPGLLEQAYQKALAREFDLRNIPYELEYDIVAEYKGALKEYFPCTQHREAWRTTEKYKYTNNPNND